MVENHLLKVSFSFHVNHYKRVCCSLYVSQLIILSKSADFTKYYFRSQLIILSIISEVRG